MTGCTTACSNAFKKVGNGIKDHYTLVSENKDEEQVQREKYVYKCIPFNRWIMLPAVIIVQAFIGSLYSWSTFNVPLEEELGLAKGTAANTFYIAVCFFGCSAAITGPWLERFGPRRMLLVSSQFILFGLLMTALAVYVKQIALVYIGYGVFCGIGFGITYITPVSPLQKWFPSLKGLMSGLAVCGFGGGSMIFSQVQNALIHSVGCTYTFIILAAMFYAVLMPCAFVLRSPPPNYVEPGQEKKEDSTDNLSDSNDEKNFKKPTEDKKEMELQTLGNASQDIVLDHSSSDEEIDQVDVEVDDDKSMDEIADPTLQFELLHAIKSREYILMYITFIANTLVGLMIISKLSDMTTQQFGQTEDTAATVLSAASGFNLAGRLLFGALSDKLGYRPILLVSLLYQIIFTAVAPLLIQSANFWGYTVMMMLISAFYGGGFGLMPAFLNAMFGSKNIGALHGIILTGWSFSAVVGGMTFSSIYKMNESNGVATGDLYNINFYWMCAIVCIGFFACLFIRTKLRDRILPAIPGQVFRFRLFGLLFRLQSVSKNKDDTEWEAYKLKRKKEEIEKLAC